MGITQNLRAGRFIVQTNVVKPCTLTDIPVDRIAAPKIQRQTTCPLSSWKVRKHSTTQMIGSSHTGIVHLRHRVWQERRKYTIRVLQQRESEFKLQTILLGLLQAQVKRTRIHVPILQTTSAAFGSTMSLLERMLTLWTHENAGYLTRQLIEH